MDNWSMSLCHDDRHDVDPCHCHDDTKAKAFDQWATYITIKSVQFLIYFDNIHTKSNETKYHDLRAISVVNNPT